MREERGKLAGDATIDELYTLWGMIAGNVTVIEGGKFYLRGSIFGDLIIEDGGRCHIFGNIKGKVRVEPGAKLIHSGTIGDDLINNGGRVHVDRTAKVMGKIKTAEGGNTKVDSPTRLPGE